jgi:hypothetical protein
MNDDWRVLVSCPTEVAAVALADELRSGQVVHELGYGAGERLAVSVDGPELFLYAGTRDQAERAAGLVSTLAGSDGTPVHTDLRRWHPVAEEWVQADAPLPADDDATAAEHAELIAREQQESAALRATEWEVRVQCPSHHDVVALAQRLRDEGIPSLRRWRYLLVGATDEDSARALSERIGPDLPAGSTLEVEATAAAVEAEIPANPFAVFGGLGG